MDSLTSRYASALLSIALDNKQNEEYRLEIKDILKTFKESNELLSVLNSSFITKDEKKKVIEAILEEEEYPYIKDFLLVIIDNSRANYLIEILEEFVRLSNIEDNIIEGFVYSVDKLSEEEMEKIQTSIESKLNKRIFLNNRLDPSLIGGIKVIVDEYVFDGTVKNKLKKLKHTLQEGA